MSKESWIWTINMIASLWKELGWSTIIYLAVLTGINPEQYEAAEEDGHKPLSQDVAYLHSGHHAYRNAAGLNRPDRITTKANNPERIIKSSITCLRTKVKS